MQELVSLPATVLVATNRAWEDRAAGLGFMTPESRTAIIKEYRTHEGDTGSPEIQVALLTSRILELTEHLKTHNKDHSSRRGLLKLVSRRTHLLKFLSRKDRARYQALIGRLGLRK